MDYDYGDYTDEDAEPMPDFGQRLVGDDWDEKLYDDDYDDGEDYWDVMDWVNEQPWHYRLRWHLRNRRDRLVSWVKGYVLTCPDCHKRCKDCGCIPF